MHTIEGIKLLDPFRSENITFAVISKKHNQAEQKICDVAYLTVKNFDFSPNCDYGKLNRYVLEGRLVVIACNDKGERTVFRKEISLSAIDIPQFIRFVNKSAATDPLDMQKDLLPVIIQEIGEQGYVEFCNASLQMVRKFFHTANKNEDLPFIDAALLIENSRTAASKVHRFMQLFVAKIAEITGNFFKMVSEARENDDNQRKVDEKRYRQKIEDILCGLKLKCVLQKVEEKKLLCADLQHRDNDKIW